MTKHVYTRSNITHQIAYMDEDTFRQFLPSKEYTDPSYESMYKKSLEKEKKWTVSRAIHYLARQDPDDTYWGDSSQFDHPKSQKYKKIEKALFDDYLQGKIILEEKKDINGGMILFADNFVFIKWAIERGFTNIPEIYKTHFEEYLTQNDVITKAHKNYEEVGKKTIHNMVKASKKGADANKEKADHYWLPYLTLALEEAKNNKGKWSATGLAAHIKKKDQLSINIGTFRKKISLNSEIQSYLKNIRKKVTS